MYFETAPAWLRPQAYSELSVSEQFNVEGMGFASPLSPLPPDVTLSILSDWEQDLQALSELLWTVLYPLQLPDSLSFLFASLPLIFVFYRTQPNVPTVGS